ncbi:MAG: bleomycin resistance protein [Dongiaceae bacterium]
MTHPKLVPELFVSDIARSLAFYVGVIGCRVRYDRPANGFAYLDLGGAELMIEQETDFWATASRAYPYGRGVNFQIEVEDVQPLLTRIAATDTALFRPVEEVWYRAGDVYSGSRQFLVQDPDGYLLRFCENLGERATPGQGRVVT